MPPYPRNPENKKLPERWRFRYGAYYYRVPPGQESQWDDKKEYRLGSTLSEAYRTWADRLQYLEQVRTIAQLLDRYAFEVLPEKAWKSQESNRTSINRLRPVFGHMLLDDIKPAQCYHYMDLVKKRHGPTSANRDFELLSHAFSKAVEWGLIDRNPVKGQVRKLSIQRRERYIEDWELEKALSVASPMLRAYIVLKLLTGLRRGDLLRLQMRDLQEDGIHVQPHKTAHSSGVRLLIQWTLELREAVDAAIAARPKDIAPWVFSTREGKPYLDLETGQANAFDSLWQRFMDKVKKSGFDAFQEKDLRKKTASDMPLEQAQKLLGHTTAATTRKHYRIKGEVVTPHTIKKGRKG
jgi:integrase